MEKNNSFRMLIQGGGNNSASEYVYIEKLLKTETLLSEWNLAYDDADSKTTT